MPDNPTSPAEPLDLDAAMRALPSFAHRGRGSASCELRLRHQLRCFSGSSITCTQILIRDAWRVYAPPFRSPSHDRAGSAGGGEVIISLDTETTGKDLRHGAKPFLVTFCDESGDNTWYCWDVDPFTREPEIPYEDLTEIQERIESADKIVFHSAKFDITALQQVFLSRLKIDWTKIHDTLVSAHLLGSNQPKDLTSQALMYLSLNIKPYEDRLEKAVKEARRLVETADFIRRHGKWMIAKKGLPCMPSAKEETWRYDYWLPRAVAKAEKYRPDHPWWTVCEEYANADSGCTLPLHLKHKALIEKKEQWPLYQERLKLVGITYEMEEYGVTLNRSRLDELSERYVESSSEASKVCENIAVGYGYELNLPKSGNNGSLKTFLFDVMNLPPMERTEKGEASLNKTAMDKYADVLPERSKEALFIKMLRSKRSQDTAVTYLDGYKRFWKQIEGEWYRLHPNLNVTGTDTLRMSSNNPNSQNISKKEDFNLRYVFGPLPGRVWYSIDYENLELRIPAYESGERAMIEIFEKPDDPPYFGSYHLLNASIIYPDEFWPMADDKGAFKERYKSTLYQWVKNFGFAFSYGAQREKADQTAHKTGAYDLVKNNLGEHSRLNEYWVDFANRHGYVETLPDKTVCDRGYPLLCTRSQWGKISPTVPLCFHVQGTACQVAAKAMIRCYPYLKTLPDHHLILNEHDELDFDFPADYNNGPVISEIVRLMELSGDDIGIPLKVSASRHSNNWSEEDAEDWQDKNRGLRSLQLNKL